jgi:pyruvate kinase
MYLESIGTEKLCFRRTKIVATIGPSTSSPAMIEKLIKHGVNVARINFSHGKPEEHLLVIESIRKTAKKLDAAVSVLADLCGPKIRVGTFAEGGVQLTEGKMVRITPESVIGSCEVIPSQYKLIAKEVKAGHRILLDDGNLELCVVSVKGGDVIAKVIRGGYLKDRKGMNMPDTELSVAALTAKDRSDVSYCIKAEVDYIALSFVRHSRDVKQLKNFLKRKGADIPVIAKIEKPEALEEIEAILKESDGIMVARGDLGVELPAEKVPIIQNKLIHLANRFNKPVIVATQMLESMISNSRPTRAEVTDVSSACLSGADAVMLSAETASGKYPLEAVRIMDSIVREAESYQFFTNNGRFREAADIAAGDVHDAIGMSTAQLSRDLKVRCVFVLTESGRTVRMVSADRPASPIMALTASVKIGRRLNLLWGVYPYITGKKIDLELSFDIARQIVRKRKMGAIGDYIVMLSGTMTEKNETISINVHRL